MVLVWLGVIRLESTDWASANHTSVWLYNVISLVNRNVPPPVVDQLNAVLRKTGHFIGYGILGVLVFFALRNTNRDRILSFMRRPWGIYLRDLWRAEWVVIAILFTVVTASYDEIHQTFIPSRTGRWQDVVIDTCGAAVLQIGVYLLSKRLLRQHQEAVVQPELSSTR